MKSALSVIPIMLLAGSGRLAAQESGKPFVKYPEATGAYLKRMQQGDQAHAFDASVDFSKWQEEARVALVTVTGLSKMSKQLAGFEPVVTLGNPRTVDGKFTRMRCSIETEPGIIVPFYLLVPTSASADAKRPLLICPHGHDNVGWHSYAGVYVDAEHRERILGREGNIAEQAALRGYIAIAPATRGLADELMVQDPKGRHGNRPCRAQLMHCLIAGRTPLAERLWDMKCLLDWAESYPSIDKNRIVMTGNSGGGVLTAYAAAIDERIRVAIPSCSFTSVTSSEGYIFHCDCCMVPGLRDWGDWAEIGGLVAPRHLLLVHGVSDGLHKRADVEKVAAAVGDIYQTAGVRDRMALQWGPAGHRFYPELMWSFIEKGLKNRDIRP